jgi:two-component system, cell cycle sensor histidine kinase and response regulator CckA
MPATPTERDAVAAADAARAMARLQDPVVAVDRQWRVTYVNPPAEALFQRLYGGGGALALGVELSAQLPDRRALQLVRAGNRSLASLRTARYEIEEGDSAFELRLHPSADGLTITAQDISERRRADDALRHTTAMLEASQALARVGSWEWDIASGRVVWSRELYRLFDEDEAGPMDFHRFLARVHPDDREVTRTTVEQALADRTPFVVEHRVVRSDGSIRSIRGVGDVVTQDGRPVRMRGTAQDVTEEEAHRERGRRLDEERTARQIAEEGERRTAAILDSISELFIATDREWRITFVNALVAERLPMLGLSREAVVGAVIWEVLPFITGTPFHEAALRSAAENVEVEVEAYYPPLERWFAARIAPSSDGMVSYSRDVSSRKRAERAARDTSRLLSTIVETATDLIFAKDLDGRYIVANGATARLIGRPAADIIGRTDAELFPAAAAAIRAGDESVIATGETLVADHVLLVGGEARHHQASRSVLRDAAGAPAGIVGISRDVTERARAEAEIRRLNRDLEERVADLQALLDVIPVGIAVTSDTAASDLTINPAFADMLGVPVGSNPSLTGPDAAAAGYRVLRGGRELAPSELPMQRAAAGEAIDGEEIDVVRADGGRSVLLCYAAPLRGADGASRGAVGAFLDITVRRREELAQRMLSRASALLNSTLDYETTLAAIARMAVPALADYCLVDVLGDDGRPQRVELAHVDPVVEAAVSPIARRYPPDPAWEDHPISRALRTGEPTFVPVLDAGVRAGYAVDAAQRAYMDRLDARSLLSVPLRVHGRILGAVTLCYSVSARRYTPDDVALAEDLAARAALAVVNARLYRTAQSELAQRAQAETDLSKWKHIFEHAGWGVAIGNAGATHFEAVNTAFAAMHGYTVEELVGRPIETIIAPDARAPLRQSIRTALRDGRHDFETRHVTRDGHEFPARVDLAAVRGRNDEVLYFAANVQDLTERERAEEQIRQAQKMDAVGRLAGGVAHDFNNMLMIIIGFSDFLCNALDDDDPRRRDAEEIRKAAERAAALTRQLLAFGRQQHVRPQVLDVNAVVRDMELMFRPLLGEDIRLVTSLGTGVGGVQADRGQMEQVIMNLALNARDAMSGGGRLTIETSDITFTQGQAYRQVGIDLPAGDYVVLVVDDTGHGMDAATRARIFEPFFSTKRTAENSGLGLAVVYGIVSQSGGYLWVESEPGEGASFTICFPRVPLESDDRPVERPAAAARGSETVLVVEDEESVRTLAGRVLTEAGYAVIAARDGREALALVEDGLAVDIVLTDVVMPVMGGRELCDRIRSARPALPVLFMSGYTGTDVVRRGLRDTGVPFLQKPFSPDSLTRKVREVLDARTDASPN